ncbi:MAG: carboxypeptidase-like regulatory domain-containing protein [Acidobacteriota bacterium]|nr:carboxypeptidase-like regulatory domain-containing protein [Acidobacteriota bacterium]
MVFRQTMVMFRVVVVTTLFVLSLVSTGVSPVLAQDTTGAGAISGTVFFTDRRPVADARVCALGTTACATTDSAGRFRIPDLRAGAYPLEILAGVGAPVTTEAVQVRAGLEGTIDVTLPAAGALNSPSPSPPPPSASRRK